MSRIPKKRPVRIGYPILEEWPEGSGPLWPIVTGVAESFGVRREDVVIDEQVQSVTIANLPRDPESLPWWAVGRRIARLTGKEEIRRRSEPKVFALPPAAIKHFQQEGDIRPLLFELDGWWHASLNIESQPPPSSDKKPPRWLRTE